jgi:segregation and condensation protein B
MNDFKTNQIEIEGINNKEKLFSVIESLLFISGEPINIKEISSIIECSEEFTEQLLVEMKIKYEENSRGITLVQLKDKYVLGTKSENSEYIQKLLKSNSRQSLSKASLETLAIIVYKQPITRIEIDEIRGVKSDRAIQTLVDKNLIKAVGKKEVPGRPILYATTDEFLSYFGLKDIEEMPALEKFVEKLSENIQDNVAVDEEMYNILNSEKYESIDEEEEN